MGADEHEQSVESEDAEATETSQPNEANTTSEVDQRVDGVLEIEDALRDLPGADAGIDEEEAVGQVLEVQQIETERVPDAYPLSIESEQAIAFRVQIELDRETTVYLAWPDKYDESADLARLLNRLDISPDRFADVLGEEIELKVVEGQWVPEGASKSVTKPAPEQLDELPTPPGKETTTDSGPEVVMNDGTVAVVEDANGTRVVNADELDEHLEATEQTTGPQTSTAVEEKPAESTSETYYYGVVGFAAFWLGFVTDPLSLFSFFVPGMLTVLLILVTPIAFPYMVYRDSEYVSEHSNWDPHIGWALGTALWIINILVVAGYLIKRYETLH